MRPLFGSALTLRAVLLTREELFRFFFGIDQLDFGLVHGSIIDEVNSSSQLTLWCVITAWQ
ncbi:hypothetical protein D514_0104235 [Microbacterium sp. UCD-TDU]|nr:hypothetical protein D514_0104235 [Microbacterium sp. UCD-TDU]